MARVLLVYHDENVADIEADELRRAGYEVDRCAGPIGGGACPVLNGEPCWQVEKADVLVYDVWESGHRGEDLISDLRELHPDKQLVLTSSGSTLDRVEADEGPGRPPIFHAPTRATLIPAIERALRARTPPGLAVTAASLAERHPRPYVGPHW
jgi:DNA-binding NtrC family response regulator